MCEMWRQQPWEVNPLLVAREGDGETEGVRKCHGGSLPSSGGVRCAVDILMFVITVAWPSRRWGRELQITPL
jgi:hypothetical protein